MRRLADTVLGLRVNARTHRVTKEPEVREKEKITRPNGLRYFVAGAIAIAFVLWYALQIWTEITPFSWLPQSIQERIGWVNVETPISNAESAHVARSSTQPQQLNEKLLDLRGKLGDSFGPVNAVLSSLGFIALLYSLNLQRALSAEQDQVQQRQRFEELFAIAMRANRDALMDIRDVQIEYDPPSDKALSALGFPGRSRIGHTWHGKQLYNAFGEPTLKMNLIAK